MNESSSVITVIACLVHKGLSSKSCKKRENSFNFSNLNDGTMLVNNDCQPILFENACSVLLNDNENRRNYRNLLLVSLETYRAPEQL